AGSARLDATLDRPDLVGAHLCASLGRGIFGRTFWARVLDGLQRAVVPRRPVTAGGFVDDRSRAIARHRCNSQSLARTVKGSAGGALTLALWPIPGGLSTHGDPRPVHRCRFLVIHQTDAGSD